MDRLSDARPPLPSLSIAKPGKSLLRCNFATPEAGKALGDMLRPPLVCMLCRRREELGRGRCTRPVDGSGPRAECGADQDCKCVSTRVGEGECFYRWCEARDTLSSLGFMLTSHPVLPEVAAYIVLLVPRHRGAYSCRAGGLLTMIQSKDKYVNRPRKANMDRRVLGLIVASWYHVQDLRVPGFGGGMVP